MPKLTSFPKFDSSESTTHGDDQRIVLMKGALLSELVQQPCILKVFAHWAVAITDIIPPQTAQAVARRLGPDAVQLAQAVGLPYAWVAQGLLHGFVAGIEAITAGKEIVLPLPSITITVDPLQDRPAGRKPEPDAIERFARWYVLHPVSGMSVNVLARDYHTTHHTAPHQTHTWKTDRKTILHGIQEVERLLQLTR